MPQYDNSQQHDQQRDHEQTLEVGNGEGPAHTAHGKAQRQALIDAAFHLIAKEGFEGLRTRAVAKQAGVNVATLHYYFEKKEDLIRGVLDYMRSEFARRHGPSATATTPLEELRQELADVEYLFEHRPEIFKVLFELGMRSLHDDAIKKMMPQLDAGWRQHIQSYLAEGVQQGVFRPDLDVEAASVSLIVFLKGCILQRLVNPQIFPGERIYTQVERWFTCQAR